MNRGHALAASSGIAFLVAGVLAAPASVVSARAHVTSAQFAPKEAAPAQRSDPVAISERLQKRLERSRSKSVTPGAQAALIRNGELVWYGGDGRAVRKPRRQVNRATLFYFASFGKMMLSAFTLHQVEAGLVELDEPIRSYVGKSVPGAGRVTIRMLLGHTAGYPDIYSHPKVAPLFGRRYDPNRNWTFRKLFKGLRRPRQPGKRWAYSNTGYLVLAYVLREVTSEPLPRAFMEFLAPAGVIHPITEKSITMRQTRKAARKIAHGYQFKNRPFDTFAGAKSIPTDLFGMPWGDGAFAGTALGAAHFLDALLVNDRLLDPESVAEMIAPSPQSMEQEPQYGLGTERFSASKRTWQGHAGAYGGFSSMGYTDMESGTTLVVVANGWGANGRLPAVSIWRDLARVYVRHELNR